MGKVELKRTFVSGNWLFMPQNEAARIICELTNRASLMAKYFKRLEELGFEIVVEK